MSIADAVAALADGINGCALGRGADATDALHGNRSVDQGSTAARGRLAHLICSSKSLLREKRSMVRSSSPSKKPGMARFLFSFCWRLERSGFGRLGGECSRHGGSQEHASGDGEETHGSGGDNYTFIIPTAGVSFCCCWHGIRKNLAFGRSRPCSEASPGGQDTRSTAISPCYASTPPSNVRCAWSNLHSEITASTAPRRSPSNATARLNRCSL